MTLTVLHPWWLGPSQFLFWMILLITFILWYDIRKEKKEPRRSGV